MTDILKHAKITTPFSNPDEDRATITRLTAEVERLRAALEEIVKPGGADDFWQCFDIARAALHPAEKKEVNS
jgi:hypothetical protein